MSSAFVSIVLLFTMRFILNHLNEWLPQQTMIAAAHRLIPNTHG
jgi:hypothetical protein